MEIKIQALVGRIHDTSFGGYPYKVVATVEVSAQDFKRLKGDLGNLVLDVNNAVYALSPEVPSYNPMVDSKRRAKGGVKTLEFVYHFKDHERALKVGFNTKLLRNGEYLPAFGDYVNLLNKKAA